MIYIRTEYKTVVREKKWRMLQRPLQVEHKKFALCERSGWVDVGMTI